MKKIGCAKCGGAVKPKMAKGGMPTKVLGPAKKPFAAGIPYFTGAGQTGPEYMQKGGSFAPNRVVQASCKGGMVRDANGKCVMARKMQEGGNWIEGAIKRPGAFSAKAKKAGMSTSAYASNVLKEGSKASTRTKRQAALAQTLSGMRKKKK